MATRARSSTLPGIERRWSDSELSSTVLPQDAKAPLVLAIDTGTSSTRAILYDASGRAVQGLEAQLSYEIETGLDGRSTFDANALRALTEAVIDLVGAEIGKKKVAAVGIACFWHSLIGLDELGEPITPILYWGDNRSVDQVDQLRS